MDNIQNIHKLPFILMDPLNLDIKHSILVNLDITLFFDPIHEVTFI